MDLARQALAAQPFSVSIGTQLREFSEGVAELQVPVLPWQAHQHGYVHGGVISYLADNAMAFAAGSVLGPHVASSVFTITYLQPVPMDKNGGLLIARATVIRGGRRQAACRCEVGVEFADEPRRLVAIAQGTVVRTTFRPE